MKRKYEELMRLLLKTNRELRDNFLPQIEQDYATAAGMPTASFVGRGREYVNEAQIRKYILDPILASLGWRLDNINNALIEAPAEDFQQNGRHRRFLDYFGRETTNEKVHSLLIVEAKRLSIDLPGDKAIPALIRVIDAIRSFRDPLGPVSVLWKEILEDVADYVQRLKNTADSGEPKNVLLTNGNWFIVILKPYEVLVRLNVTEEEVFVFEDLQDAAGKADRLYDLVSFESLSEQIPPQHFGMLYTFLEENKNEPLPVSISLEIYANAMSVSKPLFGVDPVANVRVPNGGWVTFYLNELGSDPVILRKELELERDMEEVEMRANHLLERLNDQSPLQLVDTKEYIEYLPEPKFPSTKLLSVKEDKKFIWHLGKEKRPFLAANEFDKCKFHSHTACHQEGMAQLDNALLCQSLEPPSYFINASPLHCAHKSVHVLRQKKCEIGLIEQFLCCRRCASNQVCWPEGFNDFPCESS